MVKLLSRLRWQYRTFLHDRRQLAVASVALSLAVVQPSHAQDASAAQASAADTRRLEIVAPFDIKGADPLLSGILFQRMQIVETLVEVDATGELQPGLATDWEVSDDGLEWRFTLRSGVQFHDGSQLDAEVARQVLEIASAKPGLLKSVPVERIVAEDAQTLVIALSEPFAALPAYLADYRQQILAPAAFDETGTAQQVIGTGPYRMLRMTPPLSLEVTAFEDYWGPQPEVRQARYQAVSRAEGRALIAESGDADFTYGLDPASRQRLSQSPASLPVAACDSGSGRDAAHDAVEGQRQSSGLSGPRCTACIESGDRSHRHRAGRAALSAWRQPAVPADGGRLA